jgi:lysophospholipase L1-like esterase
MTVASRLRGLSLLPMLATDPTPFLGSIAGARIERGELVLLGDSIACQAPWPARRLGVPGMRSDQLLDAFDRYPPLGRARGVILSIGTNDVWQWRARGLERRVSAILDRIPAPVALLAISARLRGVERANAALRGAAGDRAAFIAPTPFLQPDGVHVAPEGYADLARRMVDLLTGLDRPRAAAKSRRR